MKEVWTDQALARLTEIEDHIAMNDPGAALRHVDRLVKRGDSLDRFSSRGRRVPELSRSDLRELIEGNFRIVYRIRVRVVEILTVFEAHHLLPLDDLDHA